MQESRRAGGGRASRGVTADPRSPLYFSKMSLKAVLSASDVYLGLVGLGVLFVPRYFGIGVRRQTV